MTQEIRLSDVLNDDGFTISFVKLTGKRIKDITGYLSREFGDVTFKICDIVLEDDTEIDVEGEHDFPYMSFYPDQIPPNMDNETLERLHDEDK